MKKIGITGGIGSGKSTVCRVFSILNVPVYEADERAKWLTNHDPILKADIVRLLGPNAYDAAGQYNRAFVAAQVFTNPDLLKQLNTLIHPRVFADTARWVDEHEQYPYVLKEAALMNAAGDGNDLDAVVVVTAPEPLRVARIRQRDPQRSTTEIQAIIDRQISEEARLKLADFVLVNDEANLLLPQILRLHELFLGKATVV
ncbi:dephospho-CoA kinase [Fibrella aestuarina BUZ 2]|uniref:Dephospho-CoA kinase n=1 Tax=Fibrella aestuarina BUZ 2 TaxID=1166018 RepID=I0K9B4_9BACT|nr:dephospho-CoA kinase [Fibrella aestuarina]CCH00717.1 dephospho-CoA kinase [Fibrella aestuarina BUZ 2]